MRSSDKFEVSELIGLGISHPCTTFDKWKLIPLVDDDYDVVDLIHTFF
jgi:D-serine dehydratase